MVLTGRLEKVESVTSCLVARKIYYKNKMKVEKFEDLEVWQEARELSKYIFTLTSKEPFSRDFKLRDQIHGSSGSIMDNIAEGFERDGRREFIQFLSIAKGSCGETRSQSYRAFDFKYINQDELNQLLECTVRLGKRIGSFMYYLKRSTIKGSKFE
jgi:four helix bundle protein